MSIVYFISDAHLGLGSHDEERAKETKLLNFLEHIRNEASELFIVGDLFDAWFEYRTVVPKGFHRLFAMLDDFTQRGIRVHYLAGNHDYWIRDFFGEHLGMKTYHDAFDITVDGKKIYIHHGDGLASKDTGYRILKGILRSKINIWLYSWLHPDLGISLARSSSRKSRHYTSTKDYGEHDAMESFAKKKIDEGYDMIIMGHRHRPAFVEYKNGVYINLGDWISHNSYAEFRDGTISLKFWPEAAI
ncbi:MAG TPA: UDP-2,3-diacylglucosamine diphosphatase [Bacteroidota bacterium]|jgi:UDP-2,3-diacylglucosamine hydrolase|nr:UDP-2,3-diacylglucosamine diphosphatase [Bacteroidota bacterium]